MDFSSEIRRPINWMGDVMERAGAWTHHQVFKARSFPRDSVHRAGTYARHGLVDDVTRGMGAVIRHGPGIAWGGAKAWVGIGNKTQRAWTNKFGGASSATPFSRWGMGSDYKKFFGRGAAGHMARAGQNLGFTAQTFGMGAFGGGWMALGLGTLAWGSATLGSSDNILSPREGMPRLMTEMVGSFIGADIGMGVGAAIGTIAAPLLGPLAPLAPVIGTVGGMLIGGMAGQMAAGAPFAMADMGRELGRPFQSGFVDSQRAATMRQRSMNMIHRSHMNARSALSQEAAAYHL